MQLEIQWAADFERENGMSWTDLVKGKTGAGNTSTIRRLLLGAGTQAMQQLAGMNSRFQDRRGIPNRSPRHQRDQLLPTDRAGGKRQARKQPGSSFSRLQQCIVPPLFPHRDPQRRAMGPSEDDDVRSRYAVGPILSIRPLNLQPVSSGPSSFPELTPSTPAGQCFCYLMITILIRYSEILEENAATKVASASIAFFFLYYIFFGIGWQGVPWLYPTEINSLAYRTKGAALGTATNWAFNFMVVEITPIGIQSLQWKFYIIWTIFNASFVPIVYLFYPETADRTLEDIDRLFRDDAPILVFRDKDAISEKRPLKYVEHYENEVRRNSSVINANPEAMKKRLASVAKANEEGGWGHDEKV